MTHHPPDVRTILSAEALDRLRASYDRRVFHRAGRSATASRFSEAAPFFDALLDKFYSEEGSLSAAERELVIIALFAGKTTAWMLAVHVYVASMEGLDIEKIASVVLLSALYHHGLAAYTESIAVVERTLALLKELSEQATASHQTDFVLGVLRTRIVP